MRFGTKILGAVAIIGGFIVLARLITGKWFWEQTPIVAQTHIVRRRVPLRRVPEVYDAYYLEEYYLKDLGRVPSKYTVTR